jgi:transglycosylase-like protein with SLT domain
MTLSGATGPELSPEKLSGPAAGAKAPAEAAQISDGVAIADIPIEIPPQISAEYLADPVPAVLPQLVAILKPIVPRSRAEICDGLTDAAQSNNLPTPFFIRLLYQESGFRPGVISRAGAQGVAQFMPETAASVGLDNPFDPVQAIAASARHLRDLAQQFGNLGLAAAAYNAGPKRIQDWLAKKGKLPQETQGYVKIITGRPAENWTLAETGSPAVKLPRRAPCQEAAGLLAWDGPERIPLPPTRNAPTPVDAHGNATVAARALGNAQAKLAQSGAKTTAKIDTGATKASSAQGREDGTVKPAVQLAASKHKHHKLQVSQR